MLYHVEGIVTDIDANLVVVDCHGVGFALNTSLNTIAAVRIGETSRLYIYVKTDSATESITPSNR